MNINGISIDIVKKNIKNLHLAVYPPDGRVRLAVPKKTSDEKIRLFVISKTSWIKKKQKQLREQHRQTVRKYVTGESHYYKGNKYLLRVKYHSAPAKIQLNGSKYIDMYVRKDSSRDYKHKAMLEWYRSKMKEQIPNLLEKWEKKTGINIKEWRIRKMKTKWGTCNIKSKRIWLNLELAKKPDHCLEYVLVHEMIHILERHHTEKFRAYMTKFVPKWELYKDELNGQILSHEKWEY